MKKTVGQRVLIPGKEYLLVLLFLWVMVWGKQTQLLQGMEEKNKNQWALESISLSVARV